MRKRKTIFLLLLLQIFVVGMIFCKSTYATESKKSHLSEKYKEWLELSEEERKNTIAPLPFNVRGKGIHSISDRILNILKSAQLKDSYDLRDDFDIEVKDQQDTDLCWAFSANSSIETTLKKQNEEDLNFSERHLEYSTTLEFLDGINEIGLNREPLDGGYSSTAFTYYSRGSGPILEEDMPFENNKNKIHLADLPTNVAIKKVDNMIYFPNVYKIKDENGNIIYRDANKETYKKEEVTQIRNSIKEHIMNYGAVTISINADGLGKGKLIAINKNQNEEPNHAVTIIGWDDTFPTSNFSNEPKEPGAYIVLNSWGEEWGDNGIYYISYEDAYVESNVRGEIGISDIEYDNLYQYDISEMYGYEDKGKFGANIFTSKSDEILTEIMVGVPDEQTCNIYVNTEGNLEINSAIKIGSNVKLKAGYNTVKINDPIELSEGNNFAIIVELVGENIYGIGAEFNIVGTFSNAVSHEGESFISNDGITWEDLYNEEDYENLCIKAYTKAIEKNIEVSDFIGDAYENFGGKFKFSIKTSYEERENTVNINVYKNEQDVTDKFTVSGNKIRGNGAYVTLVGNNTIESGEYNVKIQLDDLDPVYKTINVQELSDDVVTIQFGDENFLNYVHSISENSVINTETLELATTNEEILSITEMAPEDIHDLTGIEYFTNLEKLECTNGYLNHNQIDLTPLIGLVNLKILDLRGYTLLDSVSPLIDEITDWNEFFNSYNNISDALSPLANLTNLEELNLDDCTCHTVMITYDEDNVIDGIAEYDLPISTEELQYISGLNKLQKLNLSGSKITELTPILSLTNLKELDLSNGSISDPVLDLSGIENLASLEKLEMKNRKMDDLTGIENLTSLKYLSIGGGGILSSLMIPEDVYYYIENVDVQPLKYLTTLETLKITFVHSLTENELNEVISNLTNLKDLDLTSCNIGDIDFLRDLNLENLSIGNYWCIKTDDDFIVRGHIEGTNHFTDLSPISNMTNLKYLNLDCMKNIYDLNALKNLTNLECIFFTHGNLRDASALENTKIDVEKLYGEDKFTSLGYQYIEDTFKIKEDNTICVPRIITQTLDENSILYPVNDMMLGRKKLCITWLRMGKIWRINKDKFR